jgi:hypothetical protein
MLEFDRKQWPGGQMCGFILWHCARLRECMKEHRDWFLDGHLYDHKKYDPWLKNWVTEGLKHGRAEAA